jgi:hypothetical protein
LSRCRSQTWSDYTVSITVVGEGDEQPVIRLGIKGRADDGWYFLSKVSVARQHRLGVIHETTRQFRVHASHGSSRGGIDSLPVICVGH